MKSHDSSENRRAGHLPIHVAYAAVLLLLLTAGCAHITPDTPVSKPEVVAPEPAPAAPEPSVPTPSPRASKAAPPIAKMPPPIAPARKPAVPPAAAPPARALTPTLDFNALKVRLKETRAIGVFTKLSLKNKVDDLLEQFREYYQGKATLTMTELRKSYDLLLMKVLSLLQDTDQPLASAIVSSREAIWGMLADPKKFATLQS
jgi:hypothetical protein